MHEENNKHQLLSDWFPIKEKKHNSSKLQKIANGEVWWVAIGENVGIEINGKSEYFSRPVVVLKKLSRYGFMGVPLTSQIHDGSWYVPFEFQGRLETAVLSQARTYSTSTLYSRIGQLPATDFNKIWEGFYRLYSR